MRILMVHPHDIYSSDEPWTRRIKALAKQLMNSGNEVKLAYFTLSCGMNKAGYFDNYETIPLRRSITPASFIRNIFYFRRIISWADVVHLQKCQHYCSVPVILAAYIMAKPLHYDWDDWEEMIWYESCGTGLRSRFVGLSFRILERLIPFLSDTVSVSSRCLRDLALRYGVKEKDIYFAPVGADLEEFKPDIDAGAVFRKYNIDKPLVLYVGQLHGAQYIELFLEAAKIVLSKNSEITFMIVGKGFREKELKDLSCKLGIASRVIFTGAVNPQEIPQYISTADICVAAFKDTKVTRCKSPLKIAEYMACGKAIVASNVGEVRRMLGGVGMLVEPDSASSLADGILMLINNNDLRKNLGRFARIRVEEKYNWSNTADNLLMAYRKIYEP
ncbi:MAG: glycosyltransferase family 4 protein [Candidatus Omnitrophota bacterium]|nr:glycosyltransferase family 4 protein [Candidatus Omnitrophota bacterium]